MIGKNLRKKNVTIALNNLKKIYPAYISKHNSNREKQVILLMIPNGKAREAKSEGREAKNEGQQQWHYFSVKKLQHY